MTRSPLVMALNAGSGTVSTAVWEIPDGPEEVELPAQPQWSAEVRTYTDPQKLVAECGDERFEAEIEADGPVAALSRALGTLESGPAAGGSLGNVELVGHRIVHGGTDFVEPTLVDAEVESSIERASAWAPLHNPVGLALLRHARSEVPWAEHVAVFDTSFCARMPDAAALYGGPLRWAEEGIRRHGFHGISHEDALHRSAAILGSNPENCQIISVHLGGGCSATAVRDGLGVATTMGTTPNDGMVMATRSGSVDPGVVTYLQVRDALEPEGVEDLLNHRSGLLGLTAGRTGDIGEVHALAERGDSDARRAVSVYLHSLCREIAGLRPSLERLDALVLTGGALEGQRWLQSELCRRLAFLGLELFPGARDAPVPVIVLESQEERAIAEAARRATRTN